MSNIRKIPLTGLPGGPPLLSKSHINPEDKTSAKPSSKPCANAEYRGLVLVAFLDLLGFTARIQSTWNMDDDILGLILELKKVAEKDRFRIDMDEYRCGDRYFPEFRTVSDSIVLITKLDWELNDKDVLSAIGMMHGSISAIANHSVNAGFMIRGGIELGEAYVSDSEIIGPAFNLVYTLESKIAGIGRVLAGPGVLGTIAAFTNNTWWTIQNIFYRSRDGLISVFPYVRDLDQFKKLQQLCTSQKHSSKYDEYVDLQSFWSTAPSPIDHASWHAAEATIGKRLIEENLVKPKQQRAVLVKPTPDRKQELR